MSLTTSLAELRSLVPTLRALYFSCLVDGLSVVREDAEASLKSNPWVHRRLGEFATAPADSPMGAPEIVIAARRAVLEEQPDVVLFPSGSILASSLTACLSETGIGQLTVRPGDPGPLSSLLDQLKNQRIASQPRPAKGFDPKAYFKEHWSRLAETLRSTEGPCLMMGHRGLVEECRSRFPSVEFHDKPQNDRYGMGVSLFELSLTDQPGRSLAVLGERCERALLLEPVNTQLTGGRYTLRYGDYDNEFAFSPAEQDLKEIVDLPHAAELWSQRGGRAGTAPLPHPDGHHPLFALTLGRPATDWTERYRVPDGSSLKIVFADSGNVAGSVLHHACAINRFTDSQAWAIALAPHPLIGPQASDQRTFFLQGMGNQPTPELEKVLEEADCFVFFEDDDEQSTAWPFPLHQYTAGKAVLHLYIGYRVHQRTARLQRPERTILTPLPHIQRMYPQATFYAGFPPNSLMDIPLLPPLSKSDGVCRILHTPSVPHWTTARYPYHKDTEAFLSSARSLKRRFGSRLEIHQAGGWSQSEVLRARQSCDITFNQLRGFHGLSGDEAMLLERPCVQAFDRGNINRHREYWGLDAEFPWLTASRESLEGVLAELIESPERREHIGRHSRLFMLKYFSPQKGILPLLYHCYQAVSKGKRDA